MILGRIGRTVTVNVTARCRFCGCTGNSCPTAQGEMCVWATKARNLCTAPRCLARAHWEKKRGQMLISRARRRAMDTLPEHSR